MNNEEKELLIRNLGNEIIKLIFKYGGSSVGASVCGAALDELKNWEKMFAKKQNI